MPRVPTRDLAEHIAARGAVLTTVLITMIPLVMLITAATMVMTGRNDALLRSVQGNKAHWAAASAIEEAGQLAQEGLLATNTIVAGDLGGGVTYQYEAAHLGSDGWDNDGDGLVDEGDERSYEVVAVGAHGVERRRLSAASAPRS